ncbi:hypothetical protein MKZ38_006823 [Zalerion maritima]|uniref:Uncharacterized protein n=1 Tax=Zalerion maritima TaxID=339359 RepID=A0AAD5WTW3_9PEZI|nr:hypothetical protein MKZ38_006823 [Zalerion maritima]
MPPPQSRPARPVGAMIPTGAPAPAAALDEIPLTPEGLSDPGGKCYSRCLSRCSADCDSGGDGDIGDRRRDTTTMPHPEHDIPQQADAGLEGLSDPGGKCYCRWLTRRGGHDCHSHCGSGGGTGGAGGRGGGSGSGGGGGSGSGKKTLDFPGLDEIEIQARGGGPKGREQNCVLSCPSYSEEGTGSLSAEA